MGHDSVNLLSLRQMAADEPVVAWPPAGPVDLAAQTVSPHWGGSCLYPGDGCHPVPRGRNPLGRREIAATRAAPPEAASYQVVVAI